MSETLWERWAGHAARHPGREAILHWEQEGVTFRWSWGDLIAEAARAAAFLAARGIEAGQVCALVIRHHPRFYPLYMGVVARGAIPAVLAYPNPRLHPDKFVHGLEGMSRVSGLDWILTEGPLGAVVGPMTTAPGSTVRGVLLPFEEPWPAAGAAAPSSDARQPGLLQHSSGTTGLQKAVVLPHQAILGHVDAYARALAVGERDRIVSWLPLYHDMGMIAAFQLPLALGIPLVQLDPFEWIQAPVLLLQALGRERGTLAWLPNFAFNVLADRVHDDELEGLGLGTVRMLVSCSEPVRAESLERFRRRFEPLGLRSGALAACYAMAETTFAATQTPPGRPARVLEVDRLELARGRAVPPATPDQARLVVSSGAPLAGVEVRILGEAGPLPEGRVGEIAVRSPWMFDGYRNRPVESAAAMQHGWLLTGDLGFLEGGECFVIGRKKDIIIVAGRNLHPEDIEDAVGQVPGVLPGRVVAFAEDDAALGTERVCVIAETARPASEGAALRQAIVRAGMAIDVTIARAVLAPPRWLIKSSSGKLGRSANRQRLLEDPPRGGEP